MQSKTDTELLHAYTRYGSEAAFGEIVRRYADFVYSAALRQVYDPELARDVAQVVFVDLARKAASLRPETLLIGWLCRGARLAALDQLRRHQRRLQRERQAMELAAPSPEPSTDWSALGPVLDEALARLGEEDRHALLLRFFKDESLAAVGTTLGVSEDAAQKRVARALGKLRDFLAERGIHTTAAALSLTLAANAVQAAPAGLAAALTAGALAQAAAATPASLTLLNLLKSLNMKTTILSLVLAGGVAGLTVQQVRTQRQLHEAQSTLQRQSESLQALQGAQEQLAAQSKELERLRAQQPELAQLRGEVTRQRRAAAAAPQAAPAPLTILTPAAAPATNTASPSVGLAAKFVLLPTESLKLLNLPWSGAPDGTATALLTQEQFQALNQALEGASDVKVLGSPRIITSPGVEAKLFTGPKQSGARTVAMQGGGTVGSFSSASQLNAGGAPGADTSPGMTLKVLPAVTEGSSSFDLQLTAGFGQWADHSAAQDGSQTAVQVTETKAHLLVAPGQTALLVKAVPNEGWTETDNAVPGPKSLLVFVTPSLVHTSSRLANIVERLTPAAKAN